MSVLKNKYSFFLSSSIKQFSYYKHLGEKTMEQLREEQLFQLPSKDTNSISIIVNHLYGNMMSRWTNFLNSDGEKDFRNRDQEFEAIIKTKMELDDKWHKGWNCLFDTLNKLSADDLEKTIYIRKKGHTVLEAILRQLSHYSYHIGQIVFIGVLFTGDDWKSLSIPKGDSKKYNEASFSKGERKEHFTDQFLKKP